ncbi:hypothetical protein ACFLWZ_02160 [Chloroflexota bacterium]
MAQDKLEKWQVALNKWDKWNQSIIQCRESIRQKYGVLDELLANAKFSVEVGGEANNPTFSIDMNTEEETIWAIVKKIRDFSERFILKNIGIYPDLFQFHVFQTWWLKSAFPSLGDWFELEPYNEEAMLKPWYSPKVIKKGKGRIIIDRICWHRKEVEPKDIIQLIPSIWRENDKDIIRRASGGPLSKDKDSIEYPEGIVCNILKYKQRLSEEETAEVFGWKVYKDDANHLRPTCTTYRKRFRQVRGMIDMSIIKST